MKSSPSLYSEGLFYWKIKRAGDNNEFVKTQAKSVMIYRKIQNRLKT